MRKDDSEREITLPELKDLLFQNAHEEMEGHLKSREQHEEKWAEVQRQRYVAVFGVIDRANLNEEFADYRRRRKEEKAKK